MTIALSFLAAGSQFGTFTFLLALGFLYLVGAFLFDGVFGGGDADSPDHDGDIISVFSPKVVAIFLVGFGAAGALATHFGLSVVPAIAWAFGGGGALGALGYLGTRALYRQQCSSDVNPADAVGRYATVTTAIPANGVGEVSVSVAGQHMTYTARSSDSAPVARTRQVKVAAVTGNDLIVSIA